MQCEGMRRHGGAFTLGKPVWEQCTNDAIVRLTIQQDGDIEATVYGACAECWTEAINHNDILILGAEPIGEEEPSDGEG